MFADTFQIAPLVVADNSVMIKNPPVSSIKTLLVIN